MSTPRTIFALSFALCVASGMALAQQPGLGKPIPESDIEAWDIDVSPSGKGLPAGSGTAGQGGAIFAQKCAACHGEGGKGGPGAGALFGSNPIDRDRSGEIARQFLGLFHHRL